MAGFGVDTRPAAVAGEGMLSFISKSLREDLRLIRARAGELETFLSAPVPEPDRGLPALHLHAERPCRRQTRASASATDRHEVVSPKLRLPLRKVPGDHGPPLVGALKDRLEYFYGPGGRDGFFASRVHAHRSTVVRLNMPPGPFVAKEPHVVALLDVASFTVLFDTSLVDKTDLFTGTTSPA